MAFNPSIALFVYGTLKRGFANYNRYLRMAEHNGKARYLSTASTMNPYPMVVRPADPAINSSGAPQLLDDPGQGFHVEGEVFLIDHDTFHAMDILEGVHRGRYCRRTIAVQLSEPRGEIREQECVTYFFAAADESTRSLPPRAAYTMEHNLNYLLKPINEEIAALCRGDASAPEISLPLLEGSLSKLRCNSGSSLASVSTASSSGSRARLDSDDVEVF